MRTSITAALALPLAAFVFAGCSSAEEKACENLAELSEELGEELDGDIDECVEEMKSIKEDCSNGEEVLDCIADIDGETKEELGMGFLACAASCEEK